jgi:hypothetical protein
VKFRSAKRTDEVEERRELVRKVLNANFRCTADIPGVCTEWSSEVNEIIRRSQWREGYLEPTNTEALCHGCHHFITEHPDWARRHGHQLNADARDKPGLIAQARRVRVKTRGCGRYCTLDHMEP